MVLKPELVSEKVISASHIVPAFALCATAIGRCVELQYFHTFSSASQVADGNCGRSGGHAFHQVKLQKDARWLLLVRLLYFLFPSFAAHACQ